MIHNDAQHLSQCVASAVEDNGHLLIAGNLSYDQCASQPYWVSCKLVLHSAAWNQLYSASGIHQTLHRYTHLTQALALRADDFDVVQPTNLMIMMMIHMLEMCPLARSNNNR
jgi:hypothetical protein